MLRFRTSVTTSVAVLSLAFVVSACGILQTTTKPIEPAPMPTTPIVNEPAVPRIQVEANELESPRGKLKAIAPLLAYRVAEIPEAKLASVVRSRAAEVGVSENRLDLWADLFMSHGREGLVAIEAASAQELTKRQEGTWDMRSRFLNTKRSDVVTRQYNQVLESSPAVARIRSLTLEAGELDMLGPDREPRKFALGAFGELEQRVVRGDEYGLSGSETAILQVYKGGFLNDGFPGIEPEGTRVTLTSLWVRQGAAFRTVFVDHAWEGVDPLIKHLLNPGQTQITDSPEGTFFLGYTDFDSTEFYQRTSRDVVVGDLGELWNSIQQDRSLLDPRVAEETISDRGASPVPPFAFQEPSALPETVSGD